MILTEIGCKIIKLRRSGLSLRTIAMQLGCAPSTVSKWNTFLINNPNVDENADYDAELAAKYLPIKRTININVYNSKQREAAKFFLMSPAKWKCQICGYNRYIGNLAFHHLSDKKFGISGTRLVRRLDKLITEASKCVLVCHNCHGELHGGILGTDGLTPLDFTNIEIPENVVKWYNARMAQLDSASRS